MYNPEVEQYIAEASPDRQVVLRKLRQVILDNLPEGFSEQMSYGAPGYVVPLSLYPGGYHCKKGEPLPFIGFMNQKSGITFFHMGLYSDPKLMEWFRQEWARHSNARLDMGKSCVRLKKPENIPYEVLGKLIEKMSVRQWITLYEKTLKKK